MSPHDLLSKFVKVNGVTVYKSYIKYAESILNMEVYDDDTWVISFPKSGTTWTQEMVWLLANDLDYSGAQESINSRFKFLEASVVSPFGNMTRKPSGDAQLKQNSVEDTNQAQRPRFIKSHFSWAFLPLQIQNSVRKPKIIYVARNPMDVCVSYYHHTRIGVGFDGTLEDFCEIFLSNEMSYCPYWGNVLSFWERRHQENIIFLKYEDMKADLPLVINQVASFFGRKLNGDEIDKLSRHLGFESMRSNDAVNYRNIVESLKRIHPVSSDFNFMRKGMVGSHKSEMNEATIERFSRWIKENSVDTSLMFTYNSNLIE